MNESKSTFLLVDDDYSIRVLFESYCKIFNIKPLTASNGNEGLTKYKSNKDIIDKVITDVEMPGGINGLDLTKEILKVNDKADIFVTSGRDYSQEAVIVGAKAFIPKTSLSDLFYVLKERKNE
ncbi:MAG: response regulator [Nanoarchaeota archaeon]|nr:response regulator [Nanoarchaeota archaeon]